MCLQVLQVLVKAIIGGEMDANGVSATCLLKKLQELFGRLTAKVPTDDSQLAG